MGKRVTGGLLCGLAAVLLVVGVLTKAWWTTSDSDGDSHSRSAAGLLSSRTCLSFEGEREHCNTQSYGDMPGEFRAEYSGWLWIGRVVFGIGLLTGLGLAVTAVLGLAGVRIGGPVTPSRLVALFSGALLILIMVYLAKTPEPVSKLFQLGYSSLLGLAATAIGIGGGITLALFDRTSPPLPATPRRPATGTPYGCPRCGGMLRPVPEYQRYWCDRCQAYV